VEDGVALWNALAARTVVLDRIRLASLIPEAGDPLLTPVADWADEQVEQVRRQM
jgi:hypothetical protein